jgi:hypothetical protein
VLLLPQLLHLLQHLPQPLVDRPLRLSLVLFRPSPGNPGSQLLLLLLLLLLLPPGQGPGREVQARRAPPVSGPCRLPGGGSGGPPWCL